MKCKLTYLSTITLCLLFTTSGFAQGTQADYERAAGLRERYVGATVNLPERAVWIEKNSRFWYRKSVRGGNEFVLVDADTLAKRPAFDHQRLATELSRATGEKYTALKLPFTQLSFVDNEKAIEFNVGENRWRCDLVDYTVKKLPPRGGETGGQHRASGPALQPPSSK